MIMKTTITTSSVPSTETDNFGKRQERHYPSVYELEGDEQRNL